jgi:hypothetical protein
VEPLVAWAGSATSGRAAPGGARAEPAGVTRSAPSIQPDVQPDEVGIPRWRRPSLQAARLRDVRPAYEPVVAPIRFREDAPSAEDRRIVRYRLVRMSSIPDEIMGDEVGRLDRGDEVDVVRTAGEYVLARTPLGVEGWVHRMTLGAVERAD